MTKKQQHTSARCFPETRPRRVASVWKRAAMKLEMMTTQRSSNPKREPPSMAEAQLPGSMYPMATRSTGANAGTYFPTDDCCATSPAISSYLPTPNIHLLLQKLPPHHHHALLGHSLNSHSNPTKMLPSDFADMNPLLPQ